LSFISPFAGDQEMVVSQNLEAERKREGGRENHLLLIQKGKKKKEKVWQLFCKMGLKDSAD